MIEKFPFDMDALQKGDVLTEAFFREKMPDLPDASDMGYKFVVMGIKESIETAFYERGEIAYVKHEKDDLHILTDIEASPYIERKQRQYRKAIAKNAVILRHVETEAFSLEETREHETRLVREGRYLQAQRRVTTDLKALAMAKTNVTQLEKAG